MRYQLKNKIRTNLINLLGWRTKRKIVVIESDDWGSIRMASKEAYNYFLNKGYAVDKCHYNRNDMLESNSDIESLMEVLDTYQDSMGNTAIFTLNNVVANPDFEKIKSSDFQQYHYEPFTETLKHYPNHNKVFNLQQEGKEKGLFSVQFHGREHVNVDNWLGHLRMRDPIAFSALEKNMFTVHKDVEGSSKTEFLNTYSVGFEGKEINHSESVNDGLRLFDQIWGHRSPTMIAPTYVWNDAIEANAYINNVRWMQGSYVQRLPKILSTGISKKRHFLGQRNKTGMRYLIRNVVFEPSSKPQIDWVNEAMNEIETAFSMRKPAIICSHRVNYIGGLFEKNRSHNLKLLAQLFALLIKKHPSIEFMSSDQLGYIINSGKNRLIKRV